MTQSDQPRCPVHDRTDCSPLLNGCSRLTVPETRQEALTRLGVLHPDAADQPSEPVPHHLHDPHGHTEQEVHEDGVVLLGLCVQQLGSHHPLTEHVRRFVEPPETATDPNAAVPGPERSTLELARGVLWHQQQALKYPVDSRDRREHYRWRDLDARDLATAVIDAEAKR